MKKTRRTYASKSSRIVTTLGDLITAAYEATDGLGTQRLERAAALLSASPLARRMSRQLQFVR